MTNITAKLVESGININVLTDKKQQTDYKIKYVSEYVKQWAIISSERTDITNITFIDCMCNSGEYVDSSGNIVRGTAFRVFSIISSLGNSFGSTTRTLIFLCISHLLPIIPCHLSLN